MLGLDFKALARDQIARGGIGWLLAAMMVLSLGHSVWPGVPIWLAGAASWLAALALWPWVAPNQRRQVVALCALGLGGVAWSAREGASVDWLALFTQNHQILAMLAAVSFLKLIYQPARDEVAGHARGRGAFVRTMLGLNLFGAAINISAMTIVGDRLARQAPGGSSGALLDRRTTLLLCRAFSSAVFYSPFIGGMALALSYAPAARLPVVMSFGIPLALFGLWYVYRDAQRAGPGALDDFDGYPVRFESLSIPGVLALGVMLVHAVAPGLPVLAIVTGLAPLVVLAALLARRGPRACFVELTRHVGAGLPAMGGELVLFLGAGIMAVGVAGAFSALSVQLPFSSFSASAASGVLAASLVTSFLGVHPVVAVTVLAALVAPLEPDPNLLVMTFVAAWGIGCAVNPFSGITLTLQGRYGADAWSFPRWNFVYGLVMFAAASVLLHAYEWARQLSA